MMYNEKEQNDKTFLIGTIIVIILAITAIILLVGPQRIYRSYKGWKTDAYGAEWLVLQYAQDGSIIAYWELHKKSIGNETNSDGIYFTDNDGNVIHLSGHYIYIQVNKNLDELKQRFIKENQ